MRIAVILPSRGLQDARMLEAVDRAVRPFPHERFWTHDLPLPACFNEPVEKALKTDHTHFLFVEEDVIVPEDAIPRLLGVDADVSAINYPIRVKTKEGLYPGSSYYFQKKLLWVSLGCTMVKRLVFEIMPKPWFVTDLNVVAVNIKDWVLDTRPRNPDEYGGQDSAFCFKATQLGFTLGEERETTAEHIMDFLERPREEAGQCVNS